MDSKMNIKSGKEMRFVVTRDRGQVETPSSQRSKNEPSIRQLMLTLMQGFPSEF